jgi:hypothetical protein
MAVKYKRYKDGTYTAKATFIKGVGMGKTKAAAKKSLRKTAMKILRANIR